MCDPHDTELLPCRRSTYVGPSYSGIGMSALCPPDSAIRQPGFDYGHSHKPVTGLEMTVIPDGASRTLVDSLFKHMDVCNSPQYRHTHSSTAFAFPWDPTSISPIFTGGAHSQFADIHCVITEQFGETSGFDPPWEERRSAQLVFRGQSSGQVYDKNTPWQSSQRMRLHILSHNKKGSRNISLTDENDVVYLREVPNSRLNPAFLGTGIVAPLVQCFEEDGTCDEMRTGLNGLSSRMSFDEAGQYKYAGDFDGNAWSGRFPRLMASNAAVIKATIYREFWTDWIVPWLHFIPVQVDYSDLWDVLAFFRGGPSGEGAHDSMGKEIAQAGKSWAAAHLRFQDLQAYTFRQYLEYASLWADDREAHTYAGPVEGFEPTWRSRRQYQ